MRMTKVITFDVKTLLVVIRIIHVEASLETGLPVTQLLSQAKMRCIIFINRIIVAITILLLLSLPLSLKFQMPLPLLQAMLYHNVSLMLKRLTAKVIQHLKGIG